MCTTSCAHNANWDLHDGNIEVQQQNDFIWLSQPTVVLVGLFADPVLQPVGKPHLGRVVVWHAVHMCCVGS